MSEASEEAQKQLDRIVALGYPDVADMSAAAFRSLARPLIRTLEDCGDEAGLGTQILLVPTRELVSPESLIARTSINRMAGFTTMPPRDIASFLPQDGFEPPEGPFYLVIEPHTGTCYINREPDVARKLIDSDERLPLTLEEGLAIATQHPEWLLEKNGFNLQADVLQAIYGFRDFFHVHASLSSTSISTFIVVSRFASMYWYAAR